MLAPLPAIHNILNLNPYSAQPASLPITTTQVERGISPRQRNFLAQGDLRSFWMARVAFDPVARSGVALWGRPGDLERAIAHTGTKQWQPQLTWMGRFILRARAVGITVPPRTREQVVAYWKWVGRQVEQQLVESLKEHGKWPAGGNAQTQTLHQMGLGIAQAHTLAIDDDLLNNRGQTPGLLSPEQMKDYHHRVFRNAGLDDETYLGTPYWLVPDFIELWAASSIYGHDSDPTD